MPSLHLCLIPFCAAGSANELKHHCVFVFHRYGIETWLGTAPSSGLTHLVSCWQTCLCGKVMADVYTSFLLVSSYFLCWCRGALISQLMPPLCMMKENWWYFTYSHVIHYSIFFLQWIIPRNNILKVSWPFNRNKSDRILSLKKVFNMLLKNLFNVEGCYFLWTGWS